ncbi:UNVERIFIED_CONTAM: hypothetical protein K2H54_044461 [Gekko kuhli]
MKQAGTKKGGCGCCKRFLANNWLLLSTILAVVLGESATRFRKGNRAALLAVYSKLLAARVSLFPRNVASVVAPPRPN